MMRNVTPELSGTRPMDAENYYQILGIGPDADDEVVKQAFREKAKNYHPDRNPGNPEAELRFKLIGTAYDALKDAARRDSYNQYMAFNEGREKAERRQWSRLFSVIALLLLGPSVVFATIYVLGGLSLFTGGPEIADTAQPRAPRQFEPAREETRPAPAAAVEPKPADPIAAVKLETERSLLPQAAAPAGDVAFNTPAESVAPPKTAPPPTAAPALAPIPLAPTPQAAARAPIPAPPPVPVAPPAEESLSPPPPAANPSAGEDAAGSSSARLDPFEGPQPTQTLRPSSTQPQGESDARASARLLARLKEPDTAGGTTANPQIAALPREERQRDTFADCPACPVMSTNEQQSNLRDQAVSLAEITVAEWNACVRDGACAPIARNAPLESPVIGLSRDTAAAYAEWLSARTGEIYRILPSPRSGDPLAQPRNCGPENRGANGFEWLDDDRPGAPPCLPAATANGEDRPAGFRVARKLRRQS